MAELDLVVGQRALDDRAGDHLDDPGDRVDHDQHASARARRGRRAGRWRARAGRRRPDRRRPRTRSGSSARPPGWPGRSRTARRPRSHQLPLAPPVSSGRRGWRLAPASSALSASRRPPNHSSSARAPAGATDSPRTIDGRYIASASSTMHGERDAAQHEQGVQEGHVVRVAPPLGYVGAGGAGVRERQRHGDGDDGEAADEARHGAEPIGSAGLDTGAMLPLTTTCHFRSQPTPACPTRTTCERVFELDRQRAGGRDRRTW